MKAANTEEASLVARRGESGELGGSRLPGPDPPAELVVGAAAVVSSFGLPPAVAVVGEKPGEPGDTADGAAATAAAAAAAAVAVVGLPLLLGSAMGGGRWLRGLKTDTEGEFGDATCEGRAPPLAPVPERLWQWWPPACCSGSSSTRLGAASSAASPLPRAACLTSSLRLRELLSSSIIPSRETFRGGASVSAETAVVAPSPSVAVVATAALTGAPLS